MQRVLLLGAVLCTACIGLRCFAEEPAADTVDLTAAKPTPLDPAIKTAVQKLITQLGAADTVQREDAEKALLTLGKPAIPMLKEAEASANPEIAVRAKRLSARLAETSIRPGSYAGVLPADAVLYFELRDAATTLNRIGTTPIGKFWEKQSTKTFMNGYRLSLLPAELKAFDAMNALPKLASGKALFALSSPDTIEAHEIDPPLLYVLETQNMQALEVQIRNLFEGMNDGVKTKRQYKKFQIEEQSNACTVFGAQRIIHALTAKGMESFLDFLTKPPEKSLSVLMNDLKSKRPEADAYLRLNADGLKNLAEANQILDDDLLKMFETAGFTDGGFLEDALTLNTDGVEELVRISAGGNSKNKGLLALLQRIGNKPAPPLQANQPQALDMIPYQAAFVATFNGDVAGSAADVAAALKALDALGGQPIHVDVNPDAPAADGAAPKANEAVAPPRPPPVNSRVLDALKEGGGGVLDDKKELKAQADMKDKKAAKKGMELERTTPHITRLLQAGFSLEQLLVQSSGPMVLALFPERVDITKLTKPDAPDNPPDPDHIPMAALFGMYLSDPEPIELALLKANKGLQPRYFKQSLDGGTFFAEDLTENSGGFWLSGNYLAYGTSRDILDLAGSALLNHNGNERMSARQSYIDYGAKYYDPTALLNIYADSKQFIEMPYKMGQLQWQSDPKNPWPNFALVAGLLTDNTIRIKVKQAQGGLSIVSQTPITLLGLLQAVLKPLKEAALIQ